MMLLTIFVSLVACLGIALAVGILIARRDYREAGYNLKLQPYRRVVKREWDEDEIEIVTLECGHRLRLKVQPRDSFPCEACAEKRETV